MSPLRDVWLAMPDCCLHGACCSQMGTLSAERGVLVCLCTAALGVPGAVTGEDGVLGSLECVFMSLPAESTRAMRLPLPGDEGRMGGLALWLPDFSDAACCSRLGCCWVKAPF